MLLRASNFIKLRFLTDIYIDAELSSSAVELGSLRLINDHHDCHLKRIVTFQSKCKLKFSVFWLIPRFTVDFEALVAKITFINIVIISSHHSAQLLIATGTTELNIVAVINTRLPFLEFKMPIKWAARDSTRWSYLTYRKRLSDSFHSSIHECADDDGFATRR